jgi:hypothetical protein
MGQVKYWGDQSQQKREEGQPRQPAAVTLLRSRVGAVGHRATTWRCPQACAVVSMATILTARRYRAVTPAQRPCSRLPWSSDALWRLQTTCSVGQAPALDVHLDRAEMGERVRVCDVEFLVSQDRVLAIAVAS